MPVNGSRALYRHLGLLRPNQEYKTPQRHAHDPYSTILFRCPSRLPHIQTHNNYTATPAHFPPSTTLPLFIFGPDQNNQTYQNSTTTAAKKPSHTFQPTPVRSAIRSMRFIVPRRRTRVPSNESFIFSARAVESRISSPIAIVICPTPNQPKSHTNPTIPTASRYSAGTWGL